MKDFIDGMSILLLLALGIVAVLIAICSIVSFFMYIYLFFGYMRYNKQKVSSGVKGKDVARELLDKNGLEKIKVVRSSIFTAFTVGNSYSHYFHRIRLRGLIYKKASLTSVAVAGQKVNLALLDKAGDPLMKRQIKLIPLAFFGPLLAVVVIALGVFLDFAYFEGNGITSLISVIFGLFFYSLSVVLQVNTYRLEKKAQSSTMDLLYDNGYINEQEKEDCKELFRLYNLTYIMNIIVSILELIREIIKLLLKILRAMQKSKN